MKQLLIVGNSNIGGADLSALKAGQIGFYTVADSGATALLSTTAPATTNFFIALGRPNGQMPFMIPEVDVKSLKVTSGAAVTRVDKVTTVTVGSAEADSDYTICVYKVGVHFNERSNYSFTYRSKDSDTTSTIATNLSNALLKAIEYGQLNITVSVSSNVITITNANGNEDYVIKGADSLLGAEKVTTDFVPSTLKKEDIVFLASQCAAGKGFQQTYRDGDSVLPGYPEAVDADSYNLITLRFAVPRVSAKTRDEVVNQVVHIAIPDSETYSSITDAINVMLGVTEAEEEEES